MQSPDNVRFSTIIFYQTIIPGDNVRSMPDHDPIWCGDDPIDGVGDGLLSLPTTVTHQWRIYFSVNGGNREGVLWHCYG